MATAKAIAQAAEAAAVATNRAADAMAEAMAAASHRPQGGSATGNRATQPPSAKRGRKHRSMNQPKTVKLATIRQSKPTGTPPIESAPLPLHHSEDEHSGEDDEAHDLRQPDEEDSADGKGKGEEEEARACDHIEEVVRATATTMTNSMIKTMAAIMSAS